MNKTLLATILLTIAAGLTSAQTPTTKEEKPAPVRVKPYGFVRNYFTYDSRKMYTVVGGEYDMLPYDRDIKDSVDLNAYPTAQFLAITTRVGLQLDGPQVWGGLTSGRIEADFGGFANTNTVARIRLAYVQIDWAHNNKGHSTLLMGQDWHPLSGSIMPDVLGMAAGAPFRPHSRTPQVRFAFAAPCGLGFTIAALYQLQYMYNGPSSIDLANAVTIASPHFANRALLPEGFVGINYKSSHLYAQLGVDIQTLRPRNFGLTSSGTTVRVDERFTTFTPTLYFQYTARLFGLKFRTMYAQNTAHLNQISGYAVSHFDPISGQAEYTPLRSCITYLNLSYGHRYRANLFLGHMKNLGVSVDLHNFDGSYLIFEKGGTDFTHLNSIWRIAPSFSYNLTHFNIGLEYELTGATYGDLATNGAILLNDHLHSIVNHRICALIKYNF